jgi:hypothetical protein
VLKFRIAFEACRKASVRQKTVNGEEDIALLDGGPEISVSRVPVTESEKYPADRPRGDVHSPVRLRQQVIEDAACIVEPTGPCVGVPEKSGIERRRHQCSHVLVLKDGLGTSAFAKVDVSHDRVRDREVRCDVKYCL